MRDRLSNIKYKYTLVVPLFPPFLVPCSILYHQDLHVDPNHIINILHNIHHNNTSHTHHQSLAEKRETMYSDIVLSAFDELMASESASQSQSQSRRSSRTSSLSSSPSPKPRRPSLGFHYRGHAHSNESHTILRLESIFSGKKSSSPQTSPSPSRSSTGSWISSKRRDSGVEIVDLR